MINEVAGTIDFSPYAKTEDVAKTYATIEALNGEVARADAAEKANAKAVADLAAGAVKKNTDDIAAINALLNTVDSEDTITSLKELAIWVEEHDTEVIPVINEHTEAIEALEGKMTTVETAVNTTLPGAIA
jgi:predicted oxidoreductase